MNEFKGKGNPKRVLSGFRYTELNALLNCGPEEALVLMRRSEHEQETALELLQRGALPNPSLDDMSLPMLSDPVAPKSRQLSTCKAESDRFTASAESSSSRDSDGVSGTMAAPAGAQKRQSSPSVLELTECWLPQIAQKGSQIEVDRVTDTVRWCGGVRNDHRHILTSPPVSPVCPRAPRLRPIPPESAPPAAGYMLGQQALEGNLSDPTDGREKVATMTSRAARRGFYGTTFGGEEATKVRRLRERIDNYSRLLRAVSDACSADLLEVPATAGPDGAVQHISYDDADERDAHHTSLTLLISGLQFKLENVLSPKCDTKSD